MFPFQRSPYLVSFAVMCRHLGCHVDGFVAVVAHTHVLCEGPITGRAADVLAAAHTAAEVALRLVRPGKKVSTCVYFSGLQYLERSIEC